MRTATPDVQPAPPYVLSCVQCREPWVAGSPPESCPRCGAPIARVDGIPVLLRDPAAVESQIEEARKSGRGAWYADPQDVHDTSPYRHHVRKRIAYVEDAIERLAPGTP